jgi:hypothetical protein
MEDAFHYMKGTECPLVLATHLAVNIPDNLVQSTHPNKTNGGNANQLLEDFRKGHRIDLDKIIEYTVENPNEYPFSTVKYSYEKIS